MIIKRYLAREVINSLLGITVILMLTILCQQIVRYLNYVAVGKIPTNVLMELISFEIPYLLALLLPLSLYLGIMLAYGRLYANCEIPILQMAGFGQKRILLLTAILGAIVTTLVLFLMLWVNPLISAKRQVLMTSNAAAGNLMQTMIPGRFATSPDGRHVMYVEKIVGEQKRALNVFLAQEKKRREEGEQVAWDLVFAQKGYQSIDNKTKESYFVTTNGYRYEGTPGQSDYKIIHYGKYALRMPTNEARISHQDTEALTTLQLWHEYRQPKQAAEFQWRFSIGIATLLLSVLAVPLSMVRLRQGKYIVFLPAILIYVVYIDLLFMARRWVEIGKISTTMGMWWVHVLAGLLVLSSLYLGLRRWK